MMKLLDVLALSPEGRVPTPSSAEWCATEFRLRRLLPDPSRRFRSPAALWRLFHTGPFPPRAT